MISYCILLDIRKIGALRRFNTDNVSTNCVALICHITLDATIMATMLDQVSNAPITQA